MRIPTGFLFKKKKHKSYNVSYTTIDQFGRLRIAQMINWCIELSLDQLKDEGVDPNNFQKHNLSWVINEFTMKLDSYPIYNEHLVIEGYSTTYNNYCMYRKFHFFIGQVPIGTLMMSLSLMDLEKRKLSIIDAEIGHALGAKKNDGIIQFPGIFQVSKENEISTCFPVYQSDIDYNEQVTNSSYFQWMLDSLSVEFLKEHVIKNFTMRFETEIRDAEFVCLNRNIHFEGSNTEIIYEILAHGRRSASAVILWKNF